MSRYIDADALHDALKAKQKWVVRCGDKHNEGYTYDQVHFAIDDAPSIDIVRCKECKLGGTEDCPMDEIDDEYFCNFGERQTESKLMASENSLEIPTDTEGCTNKPRGKSKLKQTERGYMWTCPICGLEVHSDFTRCPCCGYDMQTERSE